MPWRTNTLTEYKQNVPEADETVFDDGYQPVEFAESSEPAAGSSVSNLLGDTLERNLCARPLHWSSVEASGNNGFHRQWTVQLVAADKLVWQSLLEEGVCPKRDSTGTLALDNTLMDALQSYRVSFTLLPLLAKKENAAPSVQTVKPQPGASGKGGSNGGGSYGMHKPWLKSKGGKKGSKGKVRVPNHMFKLGGTSSNPSGDPICFGYNHIFKSHVRDQ